MAAAAHRRPQGDAPSPERGGCGVGDARRGARGRAGPMSRNRRRPSSLARRPPTAPRANGLPPRHPSQGGRPDRPPGPRSSSSFVVDLSTGPARLPLIDVIRALVAPGSVSQQTQVIVNVIRLPVATMAILVGSSLALAGMEMQTILNNQLASPYTLGISSAASFGAALSLIVGQSLPARRGTELRHADPRLRLRARVVVPHLRHRRAVRAGPDHADSLGHRRQLPLLRAALGAQVIRQRRRAADHQPTGRKGRSSASPGSRT